MSPKDVEIICHYSPSYARKVIRIIKKHYMKEEHQKVTVKEFCDYYGLDIVEVQKELNKATYFKNAS